MHIINKKKLTFSSEAKSYISHFVERGGKGVNVALTSLIDVFTILLIFLLKGYSAAGFAMPLTPGITLPKAHFFNDPSPTAIVSVTNDYISLNGNRVALIVDIEKRKGVFIIKNLKEALDTVKSRTKEMGAFNQSIKFTGQVTIEGDKDIPFELLQRIMFTSGQAGFNRVSLAVIKKEENGRVSKMD